MRQPSAERPIPERDWKRFRALHPILLDRYCQRVLDEAAGVIGRAGAGPHQRYLRLCELIQRRDKELRQAFDDLRRSTAIYQIAAIRALSLISDEEMGQFSDETRQFVERLSEAMPGESG